jgi:NAD(P)-dependent dehydrogenase (short-subunit alcohol dehydrogenase family)
MNRAQGKVALITGAASGIGLGIAARFAEEGAQVAMLDIDAEAGQRIAGELREHGADVRFFQSDVSSEAEVQSAVTRVVEEFDGIDCVVNNAGINIVKGIEESTGEDWDRIMAVNVKSVFLVTKYSLPCLKKSQLRAVVNIGSVSSFVGQANTPAYVASKGAVAMLSKSLALDLARYGIRVNCVCPGITDTPMLRFHVNQSADPERTLRDRRNRVPLGRLLTGADIAESVLFLCMPEASAITGTTLVVDGGYLAAAEWSNV